MKFYDALELELLQAQASLDYNATLKKINQIIPVFDFSSTINYSGYTQYNIPPYGGLKQFTKTGAKPLVYDNYIKVLNQTKNPSLNSSLFNIDDILAFTVYTFTGIEYTNTTGIYNEINNKETLIRPLFANFYKVYDSLRYLYRMSAENTNCIRNELLRYSKFHDFNDAQVNKDSSEIGWNNFNITQ